MKCMASSGFKYVPLAAHKRIMKPAATMSAAGSKSRSDIAVNVLDFFRTGSPRAQPLHWQMSGKRICKALICGDELGSSRPCKSYIQAVVNRPVKCEGNVESFG